MNSKYLRLLLALAFAGCGGDDATGTTVADALSVIAGDVTFGASTSTATLVSNVLNIQAEGTTGGVARTLTIAVQTSAVGTFTVGAAGGLSLSYSELATGAATAKQWTAVNASGSGTLTLTELSSTRVVGSFSGILAPVTASGAGANKSLSGGTFTLALRH